ncbi:hypothetical protein PR048_027513 [Dryococelus australis]|uniref:PWWP domain-containing protein n=1 Tax=Dryococelus australis TaxID=614101 RepID=A0ABQ9GGR8_9NEOP|nr:hypothetical protein PR048_027513 [Dryococelus australis]
MTTAAAAAQCGLLDSHKRVPHVIVWAQMKSWPCWPAKVMSVKNDMVNVRFFGDHDRTRITINGCFLYSKEIPQVPRKKVQKAFEKAQQVGVDWLVAHGSGTVFPVDRDRVLVSQLDFSLAVIKHALLLAQLWVV